MYYFAYGSNMSKERLTADDRVPSAKYVTVASLSAHRLEFHKVSKDGSGKADAYETGDEGDEVYGVVFEIDESERPALRRVEGKGFGYEEKDVTLTTVDGESIAAMTYYATRTNPKLKPFGCYLAYLLTGAREHNLPERYISKLERVVCKPNPNCC